MERYSAIFSFFSVLIDLIIILHASDIFSVMTGDKTVVINTPEHKI